MASMQIEAENIRELYQVGHNQLTNYNQNMQNQNQQKPKKSTKKNKAKNKNSNHITSSNKAVQTNPEDFRDNRPKNSNNNARSKSKYQSTALSSILMFFILLTFNIFIIYLVMFKNPEITEFLVNAIPQQYRNWLGEKTEIFRLRVTDWIKDFITPPEEH